MPSEDRRELLLNMKALHHELKLTDSRVQGFHYIFPSFHNSHYTRFATQVRITLSSYIL